MAMESLGISLEESTPSNMVNPDLGQTFMRVSGQGDDDWICRYSQACTHASSGGQRSLNA